MISGFRRNGRFYARISSAGTTRLHEYFPPKIWQERRWNSTFYFCIGQTEQASRELRRIAGYGRLGGVYLIPGGLEDSTRIPNVLYLESAKLEQDVALDLVDQAWDLEMLSKEYARISGQTSRLLTSMRNEKALSHNMKQQIQSLSKKFFSVLPKDPVLPAELLPVGFAGPAVLQMYLEVMKKASEFETDESTLE